MLNVNIWIGGRDVKSSGWRVVLDERDRMGRFHFRSIELAVKRTVGEIVNGGKI